MSGHFCFKLENKGECEVFEWELTKVEGEDIYYIRLPRWKHDKRICWSGGNKVNVLLEEIENLNDNNQKL
jgi:hypothetical protein